MAGSTPLLALVAAVALLLPSPAYAATEVVEDREGDAPARYDLTTVRFLDEPDALTVSADVRDLRRTGTQVFGFFFRSRASGADYFVITYRRPNGKVVARLNLVGGDEGFGTVRCATLGAGWKPRADRVLVSVPRTCVPDLTGTLRAYVAIGPGDGGSGDPADFTREARIAG